MQFGFDDDQTQLRRLARDFFTDRSPESTVRQLMMTEEGRDPAVWAELAQIGLLGLNVAEEFGGAGAGLTEVGIVAEEAGAALLCAPWLASAVLATGVLLHSGDPTAMKEFLPPMVAGERIATLVLGLGSATVDVGALGIRAEQRDGTWRLDGAEPYVLDAESADLFLVAATTAEGVSLFAVGSQTAGVSVTPQPPLDLTRRFAAVGLADVTARLIGEPGRAANAISRALDEAAAVLAMEQVGAAQRVLEMAVGYAKVRFQFGRPIGSFQAVQHTCADMLVEVECARSAARYALWAAAHEPADLPVAASVAQAYCSEAFVAVAGANIQVHGGIGFTWEHPAHLYFKRAAADRALFGGPADHRARLVDLGAVTVPLQR
ncbi:MAG TPA: acyl-CoA dehydrogenase family protein [Sporichthya sp.]|nr:acyl-CoA dehydrogenase family protein [Sporichthya sp.]